MRCAYDQLQKSLRKLRQMDGMKQKKGLDEKDEWSEVEIVDLILISAVSMLERCHAKTWNVKVKSCQRQIEDSDNANNMRCDMMR